MPLLDPPDAPLFVKHQEVIFFVTHISFPLCLPIIFFQFILQLILLVGCPGSGKSHFAAQHAIESNYHVINRDTLGTWQKCASAAEKLLDSGQSVLIDNTVLKIDHLKV